MNLYSENLKLIRKKLGYTADETAELLGVKPRTYGSWEREETAPPMELGALLHTKLNINLNWFVTGRGSMFNTEKISEKELIQSLKSELAEDVCCKMALLLKDAGIINK